MFMLNYGDMFDRLAYQRERRRATNNLHTRRYEKTPQGFLMRVYRNMKSRTSGVQKSKFHLYKGKELLDRDTFYEWAINDPDFQYLFKEWIATYCDRHFTPSIDRIDPSLGYELSNMQWITFSENCSRSRRLASQTWLETGTQIV